MSKKRGRDPRGYKQAALLVHKGIMALPGPLGLKNTVSKHAQWKLADTMRLLGAEKQMSSGRLIQEGLRALRETRGAGGVGASVNSPLRMIRPGRGLDPGNFMSIRMPYGNKGGSTRPRMDANSLLGQVIPKTPSARIGKINDPEAPFKYQAGRMKTGQSNKGNPPKKNPDEDATMGAAADTFSIPTLDKPSHMYTKDFIERLNTGSPSAHHQVASSVPAGDVAQAFQSDDAPVMTRSSRNKQKPRENRYVRYVNKRK